MGGSHGLTARLEKAHALGTGDDVDEAFGDFHLERMGIAEDDAILQLSCDGFIY